MDTLNSFMNQEWWMIACEIVATMSVTAAALPPRWKMKADGTQRTWYTWLYNTVEFLASNVFHAKSKS